MEKSLKLLEIRKINIHKILDDIKTDSKELIKDVYELSEDLYNFLKAKHKTWLDLYCTFIENSVKLEIEFDNKDDVIGMLRKSKTSNQEFNNYFFDGLKLGNIKSAKTVGDKDENEEEQKFNQEEHEEIEIELNKNLVKKEFKWRYGQLEALEKIKEDDYNSGILSMITGVGKSFIFLKAIQQHVIIKKPKKGNVYILMCPRIDVLKSLFFTIKQKKKKNDSDEYVLDDKKKKFWKDNDIIDLDLFNIIDCVVDKPKEKHIKFDKKKHNLIIINTDYFRTICKYETVNEYITENTEYVTVDECHCISGDKIYAILEELKYDYKIPIIGFSATPIRPTKKSESNSITLFSKTTKRDSKDKKIKLIYSYDLLRAIQDNVVLPYRIECLKINKIRGHKMGVTNKKILEEILKNCIENKTKKLPYKKFVIWTNRKDIMSECYKFIKKTFDKLEVYCTSSFDEEFKKEGYNTNYDEFKESKGNSVLVCINKCKEGSDIPYVDCGIYFDGVKNRSILVHIQTSGRLIRPDEEGKKTHGDLIDTFILDEDENPHTLTAQKILSYLTKLLNLSDEDYDDQIEYYNQMAKLAQNMEYDKVEHTLKIKIDDNKKHDTLIELKKLQVMQMDWSSIKNELMKQVDKKFNVDKDKKFELTIEKIKTVKEFTKECDFWKVYEEVKKKYGFPYNFHEEYNDKFEKNSWYELLEIDTGKWYNTYNKIKKKVEKLADDTLSKKTYKIAIKKDKKLPPYPEYIIPNFWEKKSSMDY
jgi:superfamily II DNA or RNA helicase